MKLQVSNVYKSYGAHDVLSGASLQVKNNEKIALVGRNGCGKTTLLKIITQQESMDSGSRVLSGGIEVGYLSQITFLDDTKTVKEELYSVFDELLSLEEQLAQQAKVLEQDHSARQLEKYDRLQARFENLGGYDYEYELKSVFFHFGFSQEDLEKPLSLFSSGQRTRIALVKLLLKKPDILLLDEPTNHLDIDSIEWLENYIAHYPSAVILVSHDRMFLDKVADEIVEIEFGKTVRYPGNYSHYLKAKEEYLATNHEAFVRQQKEIERLESLIEKFRYKKNKASFAQSKIKYLERMDRIEDVKADTSAIKASFSCARKGGNQVLQVENLSVGYEEELANVSFELYRQDRMAVVGPNGIGKSTLIKTLMSKIPALSGDFSFGHQIDAGYFDQDSAQIRSPKNVLDELWDEHPLANQTEIRNVLASFLFTQDEVFKDVNSLSGGERIRLALAKLMMNHDNLLILDEPTNHLDIPAKEALEKALSQYDGTLLFVSHDRMFLSKMANRILDMEGPVRVYQAGYDEYIEKKNAGTLSSLHQVESVSGKKAAAKPAVTSAQNYARIKSLQNRTAKLEKLLEQAEAEKEHLLNCRYEPEYYEDFQKMDELQEQIDAKTDEIEMYTAEWEEKMTELEVLKS